MWTAEGDQRYRILRPLGSGGMAEVVLAEDVNLCRWVALKRLRRAHDPSALRRLRREAIVGASIDHPNLVRIFDVQERDDGDLVIVMEYVAGDTLHELIRSSGRIRPSKALRILTGAAAGLDAVHARGIVHRDVKPANILLGLDGSIKLADLGVAAIDDGTKITTADQVIGTFSYMPLEQLEGKPPTPAMDIYALGAVAFEVLSGAKARKEPNPVALAHAIATKPPPDLRDVWPLAPAAAALTLKRAMASDPADRPRTAAELVGRLREAIEPATIGEIVFPEQRPAIDAPRAPAAAAAAAWGGAAQLRGANGGGGASVAVREAPRQPAPVSAEAPKPPAPFDRARALAALGLLAAAAAVALAIAVLTSGGTSKPRAASTTSPAARQATSRPRPHRANRRPPAARPPTTANSTPPTRSATPPSSASSATRTPPASGSGAAAGRTGAPTSSPSGTVEAFYTTAARHDYAAAWSLADTNMRAQLAGYGSFEGQMSRVRMIQFHQANTVFQSSSTASVDVATTAVLVDQTQQCSGRVQTVRGEQGAWLLDHISISCVAG